MDIRSVGWSVVIFGALTCPVGGCATAYLGNSGVPLDAQNQPAPAAAPTPLLVSAREASTYSTPYVGLVEVTFENHTAVWKQVDRVAVDFGSPAKNQSVTIASEEGINAWQRAVNIRMLSVGGAGGATAIESLGLGVAVDAFGVSAGQPPGQQQRVAAAPVAGAPAVGPDPGAVPPAPTYPDQHLLTVPFSVPPGLFTKRWILLSTPDKPPGGCVDSMIVSYETHDHETGRVFLPFKVPGSGWQPACEPVGPGLQSHVPALTGERREPSHPGIGDVH